MKPPFKIDWKLVTPELAGEWLKKNSRNRNLRSETVDSFARDMVRGKWSPNHQPLAFDLDGNIIDGQHRLAGVVKSGCSIPFLICTDVPERIDGVKTYVMDTIDRGNSRSVSDVLKLKHGYKTDAALISAACVQIARVAIRDPRTRVRKVSVSTVIDIIERYKPGLAFVSENRPATIGLRAATISGAVAFAHAVAPKKTEDFYRRLATGVGLEAESPILVLRNYILNELDTNRGSGGERLQLAELVLHTLSCVINRKPMPRAPRPGQRTGADWFRKEQPANIKFLESLFPSLDKAANEMIIRSENFKLTPAAEALVRGKEMSDQAHRRAAAR